MGETGSKLRESEGRLLTQPAVTSSALYALIQERLGLNDATIRSDDDLARIVEAGLPTESADRLIARSGLTLAEFIACVMPRRTLAHRKLKRQPLTPDESDKVLRLARVTALAEVVFGDGGKALKWLRARKHRFGERSPLALLATDAGTRLVEDMLWRLDEGMAA
jgi:putative toxin-antitoxin system antitoxin component (TIGR02293 family)